MDELEWEEDLNDGIEAPAASVDQTLLSDLVLSGLTGGEEQCTG